MIKQKGFNRRLRNESQAAICAIGSGAAPTLPPLKSEHFKPCQEKDLAYCLNDGECFVIETLSGPHKHCR
ncbi:pro-neuregulin-3, membrane-bound isoform isoform X2 [Silurus meridionalis]|nr:pro-neuregulin-3, membrane-bound isoform isoform X2 [Silurus meridionalis]